jgi:regulator of replication initiation timing
MIIDNSNTENLDLDQKEIYNSLIKMASKLKTFYMYSGMLARHVAKDVDNNLNIDIVAKKINLVLETLVEGNIFKKTAIFVDEEQDHNLDEETINHFNETGELYNPYTGELVEGEYAQISYVFECYKRN